MTKNEKYLEIARAVSALSKDPSSQVGAVIIGTGGEGGPWGYNGAPRGCDADIDHRMERPEKYYWIEHAERNAIFTAARTGFNTVGSTMVVTHAPCMDCARAIVQAGIKKVIFPDPTPEFFERWKEHVERAVLLFNETNVDVEIV